MLNDHGRQETAYSKYDAMSDMELEEILRQDAQREEAHQDVHEILYVMEVLAKRKRAEGMFRKSPEEAFESFKEYYLPEIEEAEQQEQRVVKKRRSWRKALSAVAAAVAIVFCTSFSANALGFDIWNLIVQWTWETFSFVGEHSSREAIPETIGHYPAVNEYEFMDIHDMPSNYIPRWLPEGFELDDMLIDETYYQKEVMFLYRNEQKEIRLSVKTINEGEQEYIEKSSAAYEAYHSDGMTLYLFKNYGMIQGVWVAEGYEYYLSGNISEEEIKTIFQSMEKG